MDLMPPYIRVHCIQCHLIFSAGPGAALHPFALYSVPSCFQSRGWGTDLVPPYMSQIYSQQLNLHEQASKRESLSALALAISTPR